MGARYALVLAEAGPIFGEVIASNLETGVLRLRYPLFMLEQPGEVKNADGVATTIERTLAPIVGSVSMPEVVFAGSAWAIVDDAKLAKRHEDFATRSASALILPH